jgi:predicted DNA binding CopG/RHH family protein
MANQRKKGVTRITVTISDEMLERIEVEAARRALGDPGFDRLRYIREAILQKLEDDPTPEVNDQ